MGLLGGGGGGLPLALAPALTAPPVAESWSWGNQGSSTVQDQNGALVLAAQGVGSGNAARLLYLAAPATPYVVTAALLPDFGVVGNAYAGIGFYSTSGGQFSGVGIQATNPMALTTSKYTNLTTYSANYATQNTPPGFLLWLKIVDNGTNRTYAFSWDGVNWYQTQSVGRTDFLTANAIGVFLDGAGTAATQYLRLVSWAVG